MKRISNAAILGMLILCFDQLSKALLKKYFAVKQIHYIKICDLLYIVQSNNEGIAFGMLDKLPYYVIIIISAIAICILYIAFVIEGKVCISQTGYVMILAGAISNLCDRIVYKSVFDFIKINLFSLNIPVFNVADISIFIGFTLIVVNDIMSGKLIKQNEKD